MDADNCLTQPCLSSFYSPDAIIFLPGTPDGKSLRFFFHLSIWERVHRKRLEKGGIFKKNMEGDWTNCLPHSKRGLTNSSLPVEPLCYSFVLVSLCRRVISGGGVDRHQPAVGETYNQYDKQP